MTLTYASLFTGGGLADWGAKAAGLTPVWGVEYDPAIAAVAQANDPTGTVYAADARAMDYAALPRVDVLHASPPCPNFSVAKTGGQETQLDMDLADAVCRAIRAQMPRLFTLENVRAYVGSKSLARIQATLLDLDYHVSLQIVNSADYGVPQTRERLFLFAHAGGWMQAQRPLPPKQPWIGWYAAIEDLIPTLPDSAFAPWQLARLPEELKESLLMGDGDTWRPVRSESQTVATLSANNGARAFILDCQGSGDPTIERSVTRRDGDEPCFTVTAQSGTKRPARAFVVSNSKTEYGDGTRQDGDPMFTVTQQMDGRARAFLVHPTDMRSMACVDEADPSFTVMAGSPGNIRDLSWKPRAWLATGRTVSMTPRALARFQSLPDAYVLPERKALACRIIGNGVAVACYTALLKSQLEAA